MARRPIPFDQLTEKQQIIRQRNERRKQTRMLRAASRAMPNRYSYVVRTDTTSHIITSDKLEKLRTAVIKMLKQLYTEGQIDDIQLVTQATQAKQQIEQIIERNRLRLKGATKYRPKYVVDPVQWINTNLGTDLPLQHKPDDEIDTEDEPYDDDQE